MKYCVIKNTSIIIDGSENPEEVMSQNAVNSGIQEFEILTEEEYEIRKALEPIIPQPKTELELLKEENELLRTKVQSAEKANSETSATVQELVELLIDMEVI